MYIEHKIPKLTKQYLTYDEPFHFMSHETWWNMVEHNLYTKLKYTSYFVGAISHSNDTLFGSRFTLPLSLSLSLFQTTLVANHQKVVVINQSILLKWGPVSSTREKTLTLDKPIKVVPHIINLRAKRATWVQRFKTAPGQSN